LRRGEGSITTWQDFTTEHVLRGDDNILLGRVVKKGCCWLAFLGNSAMTCGRFRDPDHAKRAVEYFLTVKPPHAN
jgi:hypothetical protein